MEKSLDIDNAHKHDNSGKCASGVSLKYRLCLNQLSSVASRKSLFQLSGGSWWWLEGEGVTKLIHYVLHGTDQIRVCVYPTATKRGMPTLSVLSVAVISKEES